MSTEGLSPPQPSSEGAPDQPREAPPRSPARAVLYRLVQVAVVLTTGGFVVDTLIRNWGSVRASGLDPEWGSAALGSLLAICYLVVRGVLWHRIVRRTVGEFPLGLDIACWLVSAMGKYVPGKVFLVLGRVYVYRNRGVRAGAVAVAFVMEMAALFVAAPLLFAWALLSTELPTPPELRAFAALTAAGALLSVHPSVLRWLLRLGMRLSKANAVELPPLRWRDSMGDVALMVGNWLVLGTGLWLVSQSVGDVPITALPELTGAFALAGVAGIAVLAVPSGVGVREGVLTVVLSPLLGAGPAAALAVLARLWMTLAEVSAALVSFWWLRRYRDQPGEVGHPAVLRDLAFHVRKR